MSGRTAPEAPSLAAADFVAALTTRQAPLVPKGLTTRRGAPDASRFAIYRNNVHVSLVEALGKRFPVTRQLVGDEFFRGMAREFVQAVKPRSPVLLRYGTEFPAFVAAFAPADTVPYLGDVARIEVAVSEAYHAAEAPVLDMAALSALDPERLGDMVIDAHPAARFVRSAFPVGTIWSNHQIEPAKPICEWTGEDVLITRPKAEIGLTVPPPADASFVAALLSGRPFTQAAEAAIEADPAFDFGRALVALIHLGAVVTVRERRKPHV
ncbi:DNA-binding domain-containing protein [Aurantimonas marianensis]|uniref:DNA-binding domain-containing protein n=1 Tax=Aurantimonas marianensis TaxID=2920428 RepID=A0A9X2HAM6_9HYPH|nr:DNA-binding domain-containing protein [Aurantimonas marianensis]MCP3054902.1 DNA-binding domain-containing protein [Aurantimonas marianensis]